MLVADAQPLRDLLDTHARVTQQQLGRLNLAREQISIGGNAIAFLECADQPGLGEVHACQSRSFW